MRALPGVGRGTNRGGKIPRDNTRTPFIEWGRDRLGTPQINPYSPGTAAKHRVGVAAVGESFASLPLAVHSNQPRTMGNSLVILFISIQSQGTGPITKSQCKLE